MCGIFAFSKKRKTIYIKWHLEIQRALKNNTVAPPSFFFLHKKCYLFLWNRDNEGKYFCYPPTPLLFYSLFIVPLRGCTCIKVMKYGIWEKSEKRKRQRQNIICFYYADGFMKLRWILKLKNTSRIFFFALFSFVIPIFHSIYV